MKKLLIAASLLFVTPSVFAQSVQQSGSVTPGHATRWVSNGVVGDGGTAANGKLTSLGVTAVGPGICQNSGPITGPYNALCLGVTQTGGGQISLYNYAGATGGFTLNLNGTTQGFVTVGLPTVAGNLAAFLNTTGQIVDSGVSATAFPGTNVTFIQSGTGAVTRTIQNKARDVVSITDFGANPDGTGEFGAACNLALNSLPATGGTLFIPNGAYTQTTSCNALSNLTSVGANYSIEGDNATINISGAIVGINRLPADDTFAQVMVAQRVNISGLNYSGTSTPGQIGIFLGASYSSVLSNLSFLRVDTGINLAFALNAVVNQPKCALGVSYCMLIETGVGHWFGASINGSQSNNVKVNNPRDYAGSGQICSFANKGNDNVVFEDPISEGLNPINGFCMDDLNSTTVKTYTINRPHIENFPTDATILLSGNGGYTVTLRSPFAQGTQQPLVHDSRNTAGGRFNLLDTTFLPPFAGAAFNLDGFGAPKSYYIRGWPSNTVLSDGSWWSGGVSGRPNAYLEDDFGPSTIGHQFLTNFLYLGDPNNSLTGGQGILAQSNFYWNQDDTWGIGGGPTVELGRPKKAWIGSNGIDNLDGSLSYSATALPAGGAAGKGYKFFTSGIGVFGSSGAPVAAHPKGSLVLSDSGAPYYATDSVGGYSLVGVQPLTSAHLFVGNGSNIATDVAASGDVTLANTGAFTLVNIPAATPMAGGLIAANIVAPASPTAGHVSIFADSTDLRLHDKNAAGAIGTTVVADTGTANNFLTAISAAGAISKARPTCGNLSDSTALCSTAPGTGITTALQANAGSNGAPGIVIFRGTKAMATGAISSGACTSAQTVTATGTLTTDVISAGFNGDPTGVTGFVPSVNGILTIIAYPTVDTINLKECNLTSASITPGAHTLNVQVIR